MSIHWESIKPLTSADIPNHPYLTVSIGNCIRKFIKKIGHAHNLCGRLRILYATIRPIRNVCVWLGHNTPLSMISLYFQNLWIHLIFEVFMWTRLWVLLSILFMNSYKIISVTAASLPYNVLPGSLAPVLNKRNLVTFPGTFSAEVEDEKPFTIIV